MSYLRPGRRHLSVPALVIGLALTLNTQAQAQDLVWAGCGISKKAFMAEMAAAYEAKTGIRIEMEGGGATRGIRGVSAGKIDLGGSCRHVIHGRNMSPIAQERWVRMHPVAWDALAVIVHKDNPVDDISLAQIRQLYKGKITNWADMGGEEAPVHLYVREGKISGVGQSIRELVFENYDEAFVGTHVVPSSGPLEKGIEKNVFGIGITGISSARRRDVKVLKLEGIQPTYARIKNGGYLLYRPLFLVTPLVLHVKPEIKDFVAFVASEEGKAIMRQAGTVPYEDAIPTWLKYLSRRQVAVGR